MEAAQPSSPGAEQAQGTVAGIRATKPCHVPVKKVAAAEAHAPSVSLPLRFIITGILMFLAGVVAMNGWPELLTTYHYNQQIISFTHLFVLGWISSVVIGAIYQLVPVALETRLHSERVANWHFILHTVGFAGMVWQFWVWNPKQFGHFGSIFGTGIALLAWNIYKTLRQIQRWSVVALGVVSSVAWLVLTALLGLFIAATKCWPIAWFDPVSQMHAHAHAGVLGAFITLIVGVSFRLLPMFTLGEIQSERRARTSLILLNAGTAATVLSVMAFPRVKIFAGLVTGAGLMVYMLEIGAILKARKRRTLDGAVKTFLLALLLLALSVPTGLGLSLQNLPSSEFWTQLEGAYGMIAILGVVSFALMGMLYKIVPFLVWYASYSRYIGKATLPALSDLYSARFLSISHMAYVVGLLITLAGALGSSTGIVRVGWLILTVGVAAFTANIGRILSHLVHPLPVAKAAHSALPPRQADPVDPKLTPDTTPQGT